MNDSWMYMTGLVFVLVVLWKHGWFKARIEPLARNEVAAQVYEDDPFTAAIKTVKENIVLTQDYQREPADACKTCNSLNQQDCKSCIGQCEFFKNRCQKQTRLMPTGWRVRSMAPDAVFGYTADGRFLELEEKQGEGAPLVWRKGYHIRWKGRNPDGQEATDGDYEVTKVDVEGMVRRVYVKTAEPLTAYWGEPEIYIANYNEN